VDLLAADPGGGRAGWPAQRGLPAPQVLSGGDGVVGSGHGERAESGVCGGDRLGPGPGLIDVQDVTSGSTDESSGDGEDRQP
jgi:hypothetical protein